MASLVVSVAGQWTSTVQFPSALVTDLGINESGWNISWRQHMKVLRQTDKFGSSQIEGFTNGLDMSVSAVFHEWRAPELKFLTLLNDTLAPAGAQSLSHGIVGLQATDSAAILVLSSVATTPARVNSFTSITFHAVTVDEEFQMDFNLGPEKTVLPFRGIVWPSYQGVGNNAYFTTA